MILIYCIILALTYYFWYQRKYGERNKILSKFPAPPSWPLINHSHFFVSKAPDEILRNLIHFSETLPSIFRIDFSPFESVIFVHDVKMVENILSSTKYIDKAPFYMDTLSAWLGDGLLISSGRKWHQRRKIITPAFHFKILEQFVEIMNAHGDIFVDKITNFGGREVDIFPLISLYALDVICESAMGYELNSQTDGKSEYANSVKEVMHNFFLLFFDASLKIKFLPSTIKLLRSHRKIIKNMHSFTDSVISDRKKKLSYNESTNIIMDEFGNKKKLAFLDLLLKSTIDGKPLDDRDIREEVDTFMFEGHDTTTSAISFLLFNLAKHPKIQEQVFEECETILSGKESATIQDLNQLNYLDKVIKESFRLHPPVPNFFRQFMNNETIDGITFPTNTNIFFSPIFMGRDPNIFPDPLKFDPARFDDEKSIKNFSYIPFSAGPRNCIGQKYAVLEVKSIVSKILRKFKICVSEENSNPTLKSEFILRAVEGINLSFIPRNV